MFKQGLSMKANQRGKRILLVDDDQAIRDVTQALLAPSGYLVIQAKSGPEAISTFEQHGRQFDLLVADIVMAGMSGPMLAQHLRSLCPQLPVLFISGIVTASNFQDVMGGLFLRKPYTAESLVVTIAEAIEVSLTPSTDPP